MGTLHLASPSKAERVASAARGAGGDPESAEAAAAATLVEIVERRFDVASGEAYVNSICIDITEIIFA